MKISPLLFVAITVCFTIVATQNTDPACQPNGIKLSLGDNFDLSSQYDKQKQLNAPRHDYTITYFTNQNCTKNYCEIYSTFDKSQKYTINPVAITKFFQPKDTSGWKGTETRTEDFERYIYEFQLDAKTLNFTADSIIQYSCFYPQDSNPQQIEEKGTFEFYHPDYSKLKQKEFKFAWVADYDINKNDDPIYNGRRFGKDNMNIMDRYIKQDRKNFVAIIGGGDYAYDMPDDSGNRGAEFLKAGEFSYATIPYVTVAGNHEEWYKFNYYKSFFRNPRYSITQSDYYTLTFGDLLMVGMNTNKFIRDPKTNQYIGMDTEYLKQLYNWFDATMIEMKGKYRWVIAFSHQNIHCFEDYPAGACYSNPTAFAELEDLLYKHKVDVYMAGHVHAYERVHPNYRGEPKFQETDQCQLNKCSVYSSPSAPVYVIDGTGGTNHFFPKPTGYPGGKLTVASDRSLGFSTFTVKNSTHLVFEHILSDQNFKVFDSFTIYKPVPISSDDDDQTISTSSSGFEYDIKVMYIIFFIILGVVVIGNIFLIVWFRRKLIKQFNQNNQFHQVGDVEKLSSHEINN